MASAAETPVPEDYHLIDNLEGMPQWVESAKAIVEDNSEGLFTGIPQTSHLSMATNMFGVIGVKLAKVWKWCRGVQTVLSSHEDKLVEHETGVKNVASEIYKLRHEVEGWGKGVQDRLTRLETHNIYYHAEMSIFASVRMNE